jgi:hypothetical protein
MSEENKQQDPGEAAAEAAGLDLDSLKTELLETAKAIENMPPNVRGLFQKMAGQYSVVVRELHGTRQQLMGITAEYNRLAHTFAMMLYTHGGEMHIDPDTASEMPPEVQLEHYVDESTQRAVYRVMVDGKLVEAAPRVVN